MFKIKRSTSKQYYFILVGRNGETLLTSEMYTRKASCKNGITALKKYVDGAAVKDMTTQAARLEKYVK